MNKTPLKHNPNTSGLSIGNQMRRSKRNNSQANQFQGALGRLKSLTRSETSTDPLSVLPDQSVNSQATSQAANIAGSMVNSNSNQGIANNDASIAAQQAQGTQGTGLNTGDYSPLGIGGASGVFLMKSPLKGAYEDPKTTIIDDGSSKITEAITNVASQFASNIIKSDDKEDDEEDDNNKKKKT